MDGWIVFIVRCWEMSNFKETSPLLSLNRIFSVFCQPVYNSSPFVRSWVAGGVVAGPTTSDLVHAV